jgi:hypothetical protein
MNALTKKFLAYRKNPGKKEPPISCVVPTKPWAEFQGWKSNEETTEQRQDRLIALMATHVIDPRDWKWLTLKGRSGGFIQLASQKTLRIKKDMAQRSERKTWKTGTAPILGGFR